MEKDIITIKQNQLQQQQIKDEDDGDDEYFHVKMLCDGSILFSVNDEDDVWLSMKSPFCNYGFPFQKDNSVIVADHNAFHNSLPCSSHQFKGLQMYSMVRASKYPYFDEDKCKERGCSPSVVLMDIEIPNGVCINGQDARITFQLMLIDDKDYGKGISVKLLTTKSFGLSIFPIIEMERSNNLRDPSVISCEPFITCTEALKQIQKPHLSAKLTVKEIKKSKTSCLTLKVINQEQENENENVLIRDVQIYPSC